MKPTVKALLVFILICTTATNVFATGYTVEESQRRNVNGFNAVEVSAGIDVFISMGSEEKVRVEAKEDIINDVITEVKSGTLQIYMKNKRGFSFFNWRNNSSVNVYITATEINRLKASSGAEIRTESTLSGEAMDLDASSGGTVKADLAYKNLTMNASSGAQLKISGKAKNLEADTSSGSIIDADELQAENCRARASSGGNIRVFTTSEITARASSGGNIRYSGNPETKNIHKSSGGSVYSN